MPNEESYILHVAKETVKAYQKEKGFLSQKSEMIKALEEKLANKDDLMSATFDISCFLQKNGSYQTFLSMIQAMQITISKKEIKPSYERFHSMLKRYYSEKELSFLCIITVVFFASKNTFLEIDDFKLRCIERALVQANSANLLTEEKAQANFEAIVAAKEHALVFAVAFYRAKCVNLLTGKQAQANFETIVAAKEHAVDVADTLDKANRANLLTGEQTQANREAIVAAKEHASDVADALDKANSRNLLTGVQAQANFEAIVAAKEHAVGIVSALDQANYAYLLTGQQAQANRAAIVAAKKHASGIASALNQANLANLLTGEQAQANFEAIVAAKEHASYVFTALNIISDTNLLKGEQAQINRMAIIAAREYAVHIAIALNQINLTDLLSGEQAPENRAAAAIVAVKKYAYNIGCFLSIMKNAQILPSDYQFIFNALILGLKNVEDDSDILENHVNLCGFLKRYSRTTSKENILAMTKLSASGVRAVFGALERLEKFSVNLISSESYAFFLVHAENADKFSKLITGSLLKSEFTFEVLSSLHFLKPNNPLTENHFKIYQYFFKNLSVINFEEVLNILKPIVQLSVEDAEKLQSKLSAKESSNALVPLDTEDTDCLVDILLEKRHLEKLLSSIPEATRIDLPKPNDYESSMRDEFIHQARSRIADLQKELGIESIGDERLIEIEKNIKKFLLERIADEFEAEKKTISEKNSDDATKAREVKELDRKIQFIKNNESALIEGVDKSIRNTAISYFGDAGSAAQTAWRAYEPMAQTVHWPNLLTPPAASIGNEFVFSNRASSGGVPLTIKIASDEVRRWSAICFLSSEKYPIMQDDFVYALAEIRRAHNVNSSGIDNPSCQPGTLSRFLIATGKHPRFKVEKTSETVVKMVERVVKSKAQQALNEISQHKSDIEARQLLCGLAFFSHENKKLILEDKENKTLFLYATDNDLKSLACATEAEEIAQWISKAKGFANLFLSTLVGCDGAKLYNTIIEKLPNNETFEDEKINYMIAKTLSNLASELSWPQVLMKAYRDSREVDEEEVSLAAPERDMFIEKLFHKISDTEKSHARELCGELYDRLEQLRTRLATQQSLKFFEKLPPLTADDVKNSIEQKLSSIFPEGERRIQANDVIAVLGELFQNNPVLVVQSDTEIPSSKSC